MKRTMRTLLVALATTLLLMPSVASSQSGPRYLGVVPDDAIVAGQVHVSSLLDLDRLQRLMNSWEAVLGDRAGELITQMTAEYHSDLAPFATNVQYCTLYSRSFQDNAPVTICEGNFSAAGYTPPDFSEVEVVNESVMVTGSQRTEAIAQLESVTGSATVAGVTLDPSLLAHFVVALPPEAASLAGQVPLPIDAIQYIELRIAEDDTQLGGLGVEVRLVTTSPEAAAAFHAMLTLMVDEIPMTPAEMETIGVSSDQIRGWVELDGNSVVLRPSTEVLAISTAIAIPAFTQYIDAAQSQAIQVRQPESQPTE